MGDVLEQTLRALLRAHVHGEVAALPCHQASALPGRMAVIGDGRVVLVTEGAVRDPRRRPGSIRGAETGAKTGAGVRPSIRPSKRLFRRGSSRTYAKGRLFVVPLRESAFVSLPPLPLRVDHGRGVDQVEWRSRSRLHL